MLQQVAMTATTEPPLQLHLKPLAKSTALHYKLVIRFFLKEGIFFYGQLNINQSGTSVNPITISAYGTGAKPVISGALAVTGWVNVSGNIWRANIPQGNTTMSAVYLNNASLPIGRWPNLNTTNKGYLTIDSHVGTTQLTSSALSGAPTNNWAGAEVVLRAAHWILNRGRYSFFNWKQLNNQQLQQRLRHP